MAVDPLEDLASPICRLAEQRNAFFELVGEQASQRIDHVQDYASFAPARPG